MVCIKCEREGGDVKEIKKERREKKSWKNKKRITK